MIGRPGGSAHVRAVELGRHHARQTYHGVDPSAFQLARQGLSERRRKAFAPA